MSYNGWTNYETWNVKLWIDNEQGTLGYWLERAASISVDAKSDVHFTKRERAVFKLAEEMKDDYNNLIADTLDNAKLSASFIADLLNSTMSEVNWQEIAESITDEMEREY